MKTLWAWGKGKGSISVAFFAQVVVFCSVISGFLLIFPRAVPSRVTGECYNCHTMHNSQGGSTMNGQASPRDTLLRNNCLGCHTSSNSDTIVTVGGSTVPIVYNLVEPVNPLAGGNFYWVAQGDDTLGHNVYGISGVDGNFLMGAPGRAGSVCGDAIGCHTTLAAAPGFGNWNRVGCQGCHIFTYHHEDNGVYRFLKGHCENIIAVTLPPEYGDISTCLDYVKGVEDDDWEQETATDHNLYLGVVSFDPNYYLLSDEHTVSAYCDGCHELFHYQSTSGKWVRHPSDVAYPSTGEYAGYNPVSNYNATAPVGWTNTTTPSGPVVMCLSCHVAHGSEYSDLLRWDYSTIIAGGGSNNTGCFVCHTKKDDGI